MYVYTRILPKPTQLPILLIYISSYKYEIFFPNGPKWDF